MAISSSLSEPPSRLRHVKESLRRKLLAGEFGHGERFLSELALCRESNLSRTTIRKAIGELVDEGLLVRQQGRGTFVHFRRTAEQQKLIGLIVCRHPHLSGASDLLIQGAEAAAAEAGYQLLLANSQNDVSVAINQIVRLNGLRAAGSLVVPLQTAEVDLDTERLVLPLQRAGQKVVIVDSISSSSVPSVSSKNQEALFDLTQHFIHRGYTRIAFLSSIRVGSVIEREAGYREAMRQGNLEIPPEYFLKVADLDPAQQGLQEADVFLAMRKPPQVILCLHDLIALNVLRRLGERGVRVPDDIAVAGFDDLPQAAYAHPSLTTVSQPIFEMGRRAIQMLVAQLEGENLEGRYDRLPCRLVVRESGGKAHLFPDAVKSS